MEDNNKTLRENLDELIRLFKKVKDKEIFDHIPGVDKAFFKNFELLVNNYDMIKDNLSEELLTQFGDPIHKMIADTVKQLKRELGEDDLISESDEPKKELKVLITPEPKDRLKEIETIDKELKNSKLSDEEVNRLLDRRTALKDEEPI